VTPASWAFDIAGPVDASAVEAALGVPLVLDQESGDGVLRLAKTHAVLPATVLLTAFRLTTELYAGTTVGDESVSFGDLLDQARDTEALNLSQDAGGEPLLQAPLTRSAAQRMAAHCLTLLRSALADPDAPVSTLSHATSEEQALLRGWAEAPWTPQAENVVAEVLRRAAETPDAPALDFHDECLTYAQLVERSGRMAGALAARGVAAEDVVGLAVERSATLVAAMLAVMMAGAAYLPLDAGHPDSRLAHMVANSGAVLVIADREVAAFAGSVPVFRAEELLSAGASGAALREAFPEPFAGQRACLLYTSGSTGLPKGVEVTHGGIVRLVRGGPPFELTSRDVIAQVANTSFDAATFEIWGALLTGARLVLIPRASVLDFEALGEVLRTERITALYLTTTLFNLDRRS